MKVKYYDPELAKKIEVEAIVESDGQALLFLPADPEDEYTCPAVVIASRNPPAAPYYDSPIYFQVDEYAFVNLGD